MQIRSGKTRALPPLDTLDHGIIDVLKADGRATNQDIADRLSVAAATVSARIRRLEEMGALRVVAVSDFQAHGYDVLLAVGVTVRGRSSEAVARDFAALPEVLSVNIMNGPQDLELLVALKAFDDIRRFLTEDVAAIDGVHALDPGVAADIVKFEFNVAPL